MTFGRFRPLAQLGAGKDGVRYRAEDIQAGTPAEVLVLKPDRDDPVRWSRVVKRLRAAAMLHHPTAIRVEELGLDIHTPFVAIEAVEGNYLAPVLPSPRANLCAESHVS